MRAALLSALGVTLAAALLSLLIARARADLPPPPPAVVRSDAVPAHADRIVSYTLAAELFPDTHTVRGAGTIVWRNASRAPVNELYVHLYLNAFKDDRTVFYRVPVSGFRGDPLESPGRIDVERFFAREIGADLWPQSPTSPGDPDDATDIRVPLPRPVQPGDSLTIETAWKAHLPNVTLRTGHHGSFHMVAQWFPKIARLEADGTWSHFPFSRLSEFYADFGAYDVTVTAPERFLVGAVGALASEGPAEAAPPSEGAPPPGPRTARRYLVEDVHDFAFAAWDGFRTLEETTPAGVKITCLYPPGHERVAEDEVAAARFGLGYYSDAFGRYPYSTLTIVHPPPGAEEAGGMEYPTLITTGGSWLRGPIESHEVELLTLHELAHQWFYGLVGTNENRWPFLDEGLTSYAEIDACEALHPDASAGSAAGLRVGMPAVYRAGALMVTGDAPVSLSAPAFLSGRDYGGLIYARTATALWSLAGVYGQATVRRAVGAYARRHRFGHPTPDDFFATMRAELGDDAETALRVALTEPSSVDYIAEEVESHRSEGGRAGFTGYALVRRRGSIRLPVDVLLIAEDGSTKTVRWDAREASDRIPYEGSAPLVAAVVDPEHRVLLDEDLTNNAVSDAGSRVAWRTLEGASFLGGVLARGILP